MLLYKQTYAGICVLVLNLEKNCLLRAVENNRIMYCINEPDLLPLFCYAADMSKAQAIININIHRKSEFYVDIRCMYKCTRETI